jgi:hypothetical protein
MVFADSKYFIVFLLQPHPSSDDILIIPENEYCQSERMTIFVGSIYAYKGLLMVCFSFYNILHALHSNILPNIKMLWSTVKLNLFFHSQQSGMALKLVLKDTENIVLLQAKHIY